MSRSLPQIYLGSLSFSASEQGLKQMMHNEGLDPVKVILIEKSDRTGQFAFVRFRSERHARHAVDRLDGRNYQGRAMSVALSKGQKATHCFLCGGIDHWQRECPRNRPDYQPQQAQEPRRETDRRRDDYPPPVHQARIEHEERGPRARDERQTHYDYPSRLSSPPSYHDLRRDEDLGPGPSAFAQRLQHDDQYRTEYPIQRRPSDTREPYRGRTRSPPPLPLRRSLSPPRPRYSIDSLDHRPYERYLDEYRLESQRSVNDMVSYPYHHRSISPEPSRYHPRMYELYDQPTYNPTVPAERYYDRSGRRYN